MNVRPLQDRILVRRVEEVEKTRGGIIIPDSAKERPLEGKVIAVGTGKRLEDGTLVKLDVKEGAGRYINRPTFPVVYEAMKKQGELRTPKPVVRHAAE